LSTMDSENKACFKVLLKAVVKYVGSLPFFNFASLLVSLCKGVSILAKFLMWDLKKSVPWIVWLERFWVVHCHLLPWVCQFVAESLLEWAYNLSSLHCLPNSHLFRLTFKFVFLNLLNNFSSWALCSWWVLECSKMSSM
jgi:hypothetical protein